jgi:hypothetical protein
MTTFRSEDTLVGLVAGAVVLPWIVWTLYRGLSGGRLPIGRGYVVRDERPVPFWVLFSIYAASGALAIIITLDLLFGVRL